MASTYDLSPAVRDIKGVSGDDLVIPLDFNIDITGYTFWAYVGSQAPTIAVVSAPAGTLTLTLSKAQTTAIGVTRVHWYFGWTVGGLERTLVAGDATFVAR